MRTRSVAAWGMWILVLVCLGLTTAQAQYRASLQGTVTDAQGAVIPGATVTLTDMETNRTRQTESNGSGVYVIGSLPPSRYTLTVEKTGFKKEVIEGVNILSEQANARNVVLGIGQASDTMTVNGDVPPALDTETATLGSTVTASEIQKLPSFGRDVFQLLQLAPGAFGDGAQSAGGGTNNLPGNQGPGGPGATTGIFAIENGAQISAGGGRREQNNFQIDGVGITSVSWAGTAIITPNEDSVKEVKVVTNNYDAEDGRYAGAQVKVISQNGTNQYHGSFFFKRDSPGLNAFQKYNGYGQTPVRNNARFSDYGGSVGGPILKNRLFAFFSYETIRSNSPSDNFNWFETSAYRGLAPAGSTAAAILGYKGQGPIAGTVLEGASDNHTCADAGLVEGVNCRFIVGQGLDLGRPLTLGLGVRDPSFVDNNTPGLGGDGTGDPSNFDGVADLAFIANKTPNSSTQQQFNGRLDFNATSRDLFAFSVYYVPNVSEGTNGAARDANLFNSSFVNRAYTTLWNHTFSPTLLNELRVNAAGWRWYSLKDNPNAPFGLPTLGIQPLNSGPLGNISPQGYGVGSPSEFNQWTYAGKDVLTKVHGSHNLKMGGEVTRLLFVDAAPWNARPNYNFNNMWDLLNDAPISEAATFNPTTGVPSDFRKDTRVTIWGLFLQDDWKVRPNLTVNLGMRWEYFQPLHEKNGNLGVVILGEGNDAISNVRVRKGGNLYEADKADFGPQVGMAWSPTRFHDKLVLRGGFGLGYSGLQEANSLDGRNNPPFLSPAFSLQGSQIVYGKDTFPSDPHSFYGYAANPAGIAVFDPTTNLPVPGTENFSRLSLRAFSAHYHTTRAYRYSFEGQYDLGKQWIAVLGYQGTATRHLNRNYSEILYQYGAKGLGLKAFNPLLNGLDIYDDGGRGNFNAFLAQLRHRFGQSFSFDVQYRLSQSKDTGSGNYTPSGTPGAYLFDLAHEYGLSDYDTRHAFKAYGIWSPTLFRGERGYMEKILGGWSLSGILNAHSGFPWTPYYNSLGSSGPVFAESGAGQLRPAAYAGGFGSDTSNDAFKRQRFPSGGGDLFTAPSYVGGPALADILSGAALPGPVPGAPGIARNSFKGPHYFDVDATLSKSFGLPHAPILGEGAKIEFRANFFNLFNTENLGNIQGNIQDPHFGQAQNGLGSRTIEMQARFSF